MFKKTETGVVESSAKRGPSHTLISRDTEVIGDIHRLKDMPSPFQNCLGMLAEMAAGCGVECERQHDEFSGRGEHA